MINWVSKKAAAFILSIVMAMTMLPVQLVFAEDVQSSSQMQSIIQYVAVSESSLTAPATQKVVVAFAQGTASDTSVLYYENEDTGEERTVRAEKTENDTAVFSIEYAQDSRPGTFLLKGIDMEGESGSLFIDFRSIGIEARYGVNTFCVTEPDAVVVEENPAVAEQTGESFTEQGKEVNFISINEDGQLAQTQEASEAVDEARKAAESDVQPSVSTRSLAGIQPMSFSGNISASLEPMAVSSEAPKKTVIVLDPGHGGDDSGAVGVAGAKEKDLTLKIAQYCKAALSRYDNVEVYMTREGDTRAGGATNTSTDLAKRVEIAKSYHADALISIHLNSSGLGTAKGAEIYYPNQNYRPDIGSSGADLSRKIREELVSLGIADRGIKVKDATDGSSYDDGSLMDYYYLVWASKEAGFPGIIVEHAFIDNQSDYYNFLSSDAKLQKLGEADAAGIAKAYNLGVADHWIKDDTGYRWEYTPGQYSTNKWEKIAGKYYYFNAESYMVTGWLTLGDKTYYLSPSSGELLYGWQYISGKWYYFNSSGERVSNGWQYISDKWYYFSPDGVMASNEWIGSYYVKASGEWDPNAETSKWISSGGRWWYRHSDGSYTANGWEKISGKWYYFDGSGWMVTGWRHIGGIWYYFDGSGAMATGWVAVGGNWYYMADWGGMKTGWLYDGGTWYYLTGSGAMAKGWVYTDGWYYMYNWGGMAKSSWVGNYYLKSDGKMAVSEWIGDYYVGTDGAWVPGKEKDHWVYGSKGWWYLRSDGSYPHSELVQISDKWYYFDGSGWMLTGWQLIDKQWYYFEPGAGNMKVGWLTLGDVRYYMNTEADGNGPLGSMVTGTVIIGGETYYFNETDRDGLPTGALNENYEQLKTQTPIMGTSLAGSSRESVVKKMVGAYTASKKKYPSDIMKKGGAPDITVFCEIVYDEASAEGVRPEVVFGQAMMETGFLQFGGEVKPEQFNFAGIGATGGVSGNSFADVRTGIRAQVQHLKAYASTADLKQEQVDPRFQYVRRGSAPYVEWLGIKENPNGGGWASSVNYGYDMLKYYINPMLY